MSWLQRHQQSERHASDAQIAARKGDAARARESYDLAAQAEIEALSALDASKLRTMGVTVVSAAALLYKAGRLAEVEGLAHQWLGSGKLPPFAVAQLREILEHVWEARPPEATGVQTKAGEGLVMELTAVYVQATEGYTAFVEELPGANAQAETLEEAREKLREAVRLVLEANREQAERSLVGRSVFRERFLLSVR